MFPNLLRSSLLAIAVSAATANAANFVDCTADEQTALSSAASYGHKLVADGYSYISGVSGNDSIRVTTWFGSDLSADGLANVVGRLKILNDADISTFTYNCSRIGNSPIWPEWTNFGVYDVLPTVTSLPSEGEGSAGESWLHGLLMFFIGDTSTYSVLDDISGNKTDTEQEVKFYGSKGALQNAPSYLYFLVNDPPLA